MNRRYDWCTKELPSSVKELKERVHRLVDSTKNKSRHEVYYDIEDYICSVFGKSDDAAIAVNVQLAKLDWYAFQEPTFVLGHCAASALDLTDIQNSQLDDLHVPFGVFVLELPDGFFPNIKAVLFGLENTEDGHFFMQPIGNGPLQTMGGPRRLIHRALEFNFGRLLLNFLLYIQTNPDDVVEDKLSVKQAQRCKGRSSRRFVVGRAIKLQLGLHKQVNRSHREPLFKLNARFVVRGHWRNQRVGEGRLETRRTWIQPYWKGPETGLKLKRNYDVSTL